MLGDIIIDAEVLFTVCIVLRESGMTDSSIAHHWFPAPGHNVSFRMVVCEDNIFSDYSFNSAMDERNCRFKYTQI